MVTGIEKTDDDRFEEIELALHGTGQEGDEPGLIGKVDMFGRFIVQTEKRLTTLEPPNGMLRDWFLVNSPEVATQWLDELDQWRGRVLDHIKPKLLEDRPCWFYHPTVAGRLIILHGAWVLFHKGRIDQVLGLWTRYLDEMTKPIEDELGKCESGRHTLDYTTYWAVSAGDQDAIRNDYIGWWCGTREGIPPGLMPA